MAHLTPMLAQMIDPEVMGQMLQAQLPQAVRFTSIAPNDTTLQGRPGDTITLPRYKYIGDAQDVAEGGEIQYNQLTTTTQKVTLKKAGIGVELSDEALRMPTHCVSLLLKTGREQLIWATTFWSMARLANCSVGRSCVRVNWHKVTAWLFCRVP